MGITANSPARADDFINESEADVTPANDAGKCVKLESDGKISEQFTKKHPVRRIYELADSPATWTKPTGLTRLEVIIWGGGSSGCCYAHQNPSTGSYGVRVSGGGGGGMSKKTFLAADLGATETVTIGAGGASVSCGSTAYDQKSGLTGVQSTFGSLLTGYAATAPPDREDGGDGGGNWADGGGGAGGDGSAETDPEPGFYDGGGGGWSKASVGASDGATSLEGGGGGAGGAIIDDNSLVPKNGGKVNGDGGKGGDSDAIWQADADGEDGEVPAGGGGSACCKGSTGLTATSGEGAPGRCIVIEHFD